MKTVVLDSQPLIAYFEKEAGWEIVADLLQQGTDGKHRLLLTVVNWGEVYYTVLREYGEAYAQRVLHAIKNMPIELVEVTCELARYAARLKAQGGLSYADCFTAGLAQMERAEILTGDKEFRRLEGQLKIRWVK